MWSKEAADAIAAVYEEVPESPDDWSLLFAQSLGLFFYNKRTKQLVRQRPKEYVYHVWVSVCFAWLFLFSLVICVCNFFLSFRISASVRTLLLFIGKTR